MTLVILQTCVGWMANTASLGPMAARYQDHFVVGEWPGVGKR